MSATPIQLDQFDQYFSQEVELSSVALGASITSVSDQFFAPASDLLKVYPPASYKGTFDANGAIFDGWESRRHNSTFDWTIIQLGPPLSTVLGFDIDTAWFNGNESPASEVWGARVEVGQDITESSSLWIPLLNRAPLGPSSRHLFVLPEYSSPLTHLKLTMHPDGGIARFRAYGRVLPAPLEVSAQNEVTDLAFVLNGGRSTGESDQHFGKGSNLLLPGRGVDMGDGWETRRSRGRLTNGGSDWVVIKLGEPGHIEWAEIDTNHFCGNFPESAALFGIISDQDLPAQTDNWTQILPRTKLGPHRQATLQVSGKEFAWTHVRLSIYPDGGVKRLRLFGRRTFPSLAPLAQPSIASATSSTFAEPSTPSKPTSSAPSIPALPLSTDAFAAYGSVIQSYDDLRSVRKDLIVKRVNFDTADKFNWLSLVTFLADGARARMGKVEVEGKVNLCVFRCEPQNGRLEESVGAKRTWDVSVLERHEFSSQAFVPMGGGGDRYLVIVAENDKLTDKPNLATIRAFIATSSQGISYHPNIWHHPIIALDKITDFTCIVHETGIPAIDCEIIEFGAIVAHVQEI